MKTAIQELIDELDLTKIADREKLIMVKYIIEQCLEKEKKQITDACWYGHDIKHEYFNPIHYFDQTYNQNK